MFSKVKISGRRKSGRVSGVVMKMSLSTFLLIVASLALGAGDVSATTWTVTMTASPTSGVAPLTVNFNASGSPNSNCGAAPTYNWDFGDGASGSGASTSHSYTSAGSFSPTVTYTSYKLGSGTCQSGTATASTTVTVSGSSPPPPPPPSPPTVTVSMSANPTSGAAPLLVNFTASGSPSSSASCPAATYSWNFGDGSSASGASTSHTYGTSGTYTATVTYDISWSNGSTCTDIEAHDSKTITISGSAPPPPPPPTATVTVSASPTSGTPPLTVNFTASGSPAGSAGCFAAIYHWDFGDGGGSTSQNPSYTYTTAGRFIATVSYGYQYDQGFCVWGPEATATALISVGTSGIVTSVSLSASPTSGAAPLTVNLTASGSPAHSDPGCLTERYEWYSGDTAVENTGSSNLWSTLYTNEGTYTARVYYTVSLKIGGNCVRLQATAFAPIAITPGPNATTLNIQASTTSGAAPLTVNFTASGSPAHSDPGCLTESYLWGFGHGGPGYSHNQNPSVTFTSSGTYTVGVMYFRNWSYGGGCYTYLARASLDITVTSTAPPPPPLKPLVAVIRVSPNAGTAPFTANFDSSGSTTDPSCTINKYHWDFGDGATSDVGATASHSYDNPGRYLVLLLIKDSCGQSNFATATIQVVPAAQPIQPPSEVHEESLLYKAQGGGELLPGTLHVSTGRLKLSILGLGGGLDSVSIRNPQTQQSLSGASNFSIEAGKITIVEFVLDKPGDYEIVSGGRVLGKLTTQAPGEIDEHTLIFSKDDGKTLPNALKVHKGKIRLFCIALGSEFGGLTIRSATNQQALFGASNFRVGVDQETVLELDIEQTGEYEIVQGTTVLGKLIVQ